MIKPLNISDFDSFVKENSQVAKELHFDCVHSKAGEYKCSVKTRYGWCCDMCLENELLWLYSNGVHTVNSCCGHGNIDLASILVVGINSITTMEELGYKEAYIKTPESVPPVRAYVPKTPLLYTEKATEILARHP